jgi:hypothetical protein
VAQTQVIAPSAVRAAPSPGSGGTLRLAGNVVVRPGDVLASGIGDAAPSGFLLKATASRSDGGDTLVDVVPATLLEAMPEGHIDQHLALQAPAGGIRGRRRDGATIPFHKVVTCEQSGSVTIEGSADLGSPEVDLSADWGGFSLKPKSVQATASVTASAHAAASATGSASCSVGPVSLFKTKLAPITFTLGVLPVVLVPEISIDLSGLGQIDANVSTSVDASLTARAGARYADGDLSPIAEVEKTFEHVPPDPQASAKLAATLTSELEVSAYGAGGPEFEFNAGLEMNADPDAKDPWWTLDAPVSVTAGLEIDVLNIDAGPITVFEKSFRLAEAAPRDPQYRIVAGELAASVQGQFACNEGETGCTGYTTYVRRNQSTEAKFRVASPSESRGTGDFEASAAVESWDHAFSRSSVWSDGSCRQTSNEVDSGPVRHTGGTDPSIYLLIGSISRPNDGQPATRPKVALRVNDRDKGNYMHNQPALGVSWPYSPGARGSLVTVHYTYGASGTCQAPGPSTTDRDVLSNYPFDPNYEPFGGGEVARTPYEAPLTYGPTTCSGARCVTRVSGVSGQDDVTSAPVPGTAKVRMTWWFDVETCFHSCS